MKQHYNLDESFKKGNEKEILLADGEVKQSVPEQ